MQISRKDIEHHLFLFVCGVILAVLASVVWQVVELDMRDQLYIYDSSPVVHPEKYEVIIL